MEELFINYSVSEIVVFIVILAFAIKELVIFVDWGRDRLRRVYDKDYKSLCHGANPFRLKFLPRQNPQ